MSNKTEKQQSESAHAEGIMQSYESSKPPMRTPTLCGAEDLRQWDDAVEVMLEECPYVVETGNYHCELDWDSSGMGKDALSYFMKRDLSASSSSMFELLLYCAVSSNHESRRYDEHEFPGYDTAVQRDAWNILTRNGLSGYAAYRLVESASEYGRICYWDGANPRGKRAAIRTAFVTRR